MKPMGRLGDNAFCGADAHGCPACAHPVMGPAVSGSPDVRVNFLPALRDGDAGVHAACCGPNSWNANGGATHVLINHRMAFRQGDSTAHCGGDGTLVVGSSNVLVGDEPGGLIPQKSWVAVRIVDEDGIPVAGLKYSLTLPTGEKREGVLDENGRVDASDIDPGSCTIELSTPDNAP